MSAPKERNYLKGAAILAVAAVAAKIIGAVFKIPLYNILSDEEVTRFNVTYQIYAVLLALSNSGIPVALSRLISVSVETGNTRQTQKYFRVALPAFACIGAAASLAMFIFAPQLASFMEDPLASLAIRVLSPAVFLCCVISVYEGYSQGHGFMVPTALKQIIEVTSKLVIGLSVAWLLMLRGFSSIVVPAGAISGVVVGLLLALPVLIIYKKRHFPVTHLTGEAKSTGTTFSSIIKVSIPIALGATFMSVLTIIDTKVVLMRLMDGVGLARLAAQEQYSIYTRSQTLFNLTPALLSAITVSVIPAISAFVGTGRRLEARATTESAIKMVCLIAMPAAVGLSVLSRPIYGALYGSHAGEQVLMILGTASFFACSQLLTTAVLQANGYERVPMISFLIGGTIQIVSDWVLVGTPSIGIVGSPIGTLACYITITLINLSVILLKVEKPPRILRSAGKPALAAAIMGVGAYATYGLSVRLLGSTLGEGRIADLAYTVIGVAVAVIIYFVIIIASRALTREDLSLLPKSERLAKILRIRD